MIMAMREDEAIHRDIHHAFADALAEVQKRLQVVFPVHPRTAKTLAQLPGRPAARECRRASPVTATGWSLDPGLLAEELARAARRGRLPRVVVPVDLYGQCADFDPIMAECRQLGIPVVEDAAEAEVNAVIRQNAPAEIREMAPEAAIKAGAIDYITKPISPPT